MISLSTLHIGDPCPCGVGHIVYLSPKRDTFRCWLPGPGGQWPGTQTDHLPMPACGPGSYTNLLNVSVTPRSVAGRAVLSASARLCRYCVQTPVVREDGTIFCCGEVQRVVAVADVVKAEMGRYPHSCPRCGAPCYLGGGPGDIEHAATGKAGCL